MTQPLVSVSIITYNQADFIHETLEGTINQDYDNLEVVVADDCSTDGTAEIIREYSDRYPDRVIPVLSYKNAGITENSNKALKVAQGKYIAFQGGDDILLPGKIKKQVAWMEENEERVLCGHDVEYFDSDSGNILALWSDAKPLTSGNGPVKVIRNGVPFAATSVMVRKSSIPSYGFDSLVPVTSDWKLWIDCLSGGGEFGFLNDILAKYRRYQKNISNEVQIMAQSRLITLSIIESTLPEFLPECAFQRSRAYYDLGIDLMKKTEYKKARKLFWSAIISSGFQDLKSPLAYIATWLPSQWSQSFLVDRIVPRKPADYLRNFLRE